MVIQCCACKKVKDKDGWYTAIILPGNSISHTYCPECRAKLLRRLGRPAGSEFLQRSA